MWEIILQYLETAISLHAIFALALDVPALGVECGMYYIPARAFRELIVTYGYKALFAKETELRSFRLNGKDVSDLKGRNEPLLHFLLDVSKYPHCKASEIDSISAELIVYYDLSKDTQAEIVEQPIGDIQTSNGTLFEVKAFQGRIGYPD